MSRFVQLHLLTSYPPANLNRDDLGRPKTAMMGGELRLRISSQSLKRAWRTSTVFEDVLKGSLGTRTKMMGIEIFNSLKEKGVSEERAIYETEKIVECFGKLKKISDKDKDIKTKLESLETEQLVHYSPEEKEVIEQLIDKIVENNGETSDEDSLHLLRKEHTASDIALFGRMLASSPKQNTEAAAQVAHAISVHSVIVEDDFFTAVDDLNVGEEDVGAGHLGEIEFAAGLFYLYVCIDKELLIGNLSGDDELANKTLKAFIECVSTVAPTGKQNSFGSRARASYILCETGAQQPRSLSVAFLRPIEGNNMLEMAIKRLTKTYKNMDCVYGACAEKRCELNALIGEGRIEDVVQTAIEA